MPRNLIRLHQTGNLHFITASCIRRQPYLAQPSLRDLVEDALERARQAYQFYVPAYVVMPEHIHLLISEPKLGTIADAVKAFKLSVTLRQTHRPFWEKRYYDFNVFTPEKRLEKLKYIHRNPVRRGLVQRPEEWAWSSFAHYATGANRVVEVESDWTVQRRARSEVSHVRESGHGAPPS